MIPDVSEALRALSEPGDWELRHSLRTLLRHLLVEPGRDFNPLFVGPMPMPELLTEEVERAATEVGLPLLTVSALGNRNGQGRGVVLLSERDAGRLARYRARPPGGIQLVIWSRRGPEGLEDAVAGWMSSGLHFDPQVDGAGFEPSPLAGVVEGVVQGRDGQRFALLVASESAQPEAIAMLRLRLDLAGAGPAVTVEVGDASAQPEVEGGGARVLRLAGGSGLAGADQAWAQVEACARRGHAAVVVTDAAGEAALRALQPAGVVPEEAWWVCRIDAGGEEPRWPELGSILLRRPPLRPRPDGVEELPLREASLPDLLRSVAKWKPGTLVIFETGRLGTIDVAHGEIRAARRVQERSAAGTAAETLTRIRDMSRWPAARALWVPRQDEPVDETGAICRIPLDAAFADLVAAGVGGSSFASLEQDASDVAMALVEWGLTEEAMVVLGDRTRRGEAGPEGHFLRAHFAAEERPDVAAALFRYTAAQIHASPARTRDAQLGLDAALNALLLEVRCGTRSQASGWRMLEAAGLTRGEALGEAVARGNVVLELAWRAQRRGAAREVAAWQERRGAAGELARLVRAPAPPLAVPAGPVSAPAPEVLCTPEPDVAAAAAIREGVQEATGAEPLVGAAAAPNDAHASRLQVSA